MGANISIKVTFKAFDQTHELIFPMSYTIGELSNYMRTICNTYVLLDMQPTSKSPTI